LESGCDRAWQALLQMCFDGSGRTFSKAGENLRRRKRRNEWERGVEAVNRPLDGPTRTAELGASKPARIGALTRLKPLLFFSTSPPRHKAGKTPTPSLSLSKLNSSSEPPPGRLYRAKIWRALWPVRFSGWVIPYQGIIEPNLTVVLAVLQKQNSRNSELGQKTSAHQSSTDLSRRRRSVGGRSNGQSHTVGWVQGARVPFGGGLLQVAPIAQHRLSDPRCTHALHGWVRTTAPAGRWELPNSDYFHHCI
jgi:hypothetical protein